MLLSKPNALINSKSPYLRQHAHNPVGWYPWGDDAFTRAKKEDKPIFLSIGYSTCHWCHVMAHESFENEKIAELMNRHFVNIKVDREERPDVDAIYMTAVQAITGSGGWPMSVWLTPGLKPFYAGTYFPPDDRYGRPGFSSMLEQLAEVWKRERSTVLTSADQITDMLTSYAASGARAPQVELRKDAILQSNYDALKMMFDKTNGGFSPAPKFLMPIYLRYLLEYHRHTGEPEALRMVEFTLGKMSKGGVMDQLVGGFSRYSTDEKWLVPHFEKMLYDNAQMTQVTAMLFSLTQKPLWREVTAATASYVLRDLRHPDGGFYSAEDADSEGREGAFYVWTLAQMRSLLTENEQNAAVTFYGVTPQGNFFDPHTRREGQNVLSQVTELDSAHQEALMSAKVKMLAARNKRPRPHRDEKILTEWNALMISALVTASQALSNPDLMTSATQAAEFLYKNLYDAASHRLYRSWCDGARDVDAQQADYALLVQALLDLHDATKNDRWRDWAASLHQKHDELFFDEELGGYFMNVARPDLLIRIKDDTDNVTPSGNSVAVRNGLRLCRLTGNADFRDRALKTRQAFSAKLTQHPTAMVGLALTLWDVV